MYQVSVSIGEDELLEEIRKRIDHIFGFGTFDQNSQEIYCVLGNSLLERIHSAFIQKSQGTTGDDGISWRPLAQETLKKRAKKKAGAPNLKDTAEYEQWRKVFNRVKWKLISRGLGQKEAENEAAKAAWADLKADGYDQVFPDSSAFRILVENGDLLDSLEPSKVEDEPPHNPLTVFEIRQGKMVVGTKEKPFHHTGTKRGLESRAFWPETLPDHWLEEILREVCIVVVQKIYEDLRGS